MHLPHYCVFWVYFRTNRYEKVVSRLGVQCCYFSVIFDVILAKDAICCKGKKALETIFPEKRERQKLLAYHAVSLKYCFPD